MSKARCRGWSRRRYRGLHGADLVDERPDARQSWSRSSLPCCAARTGRG